MPDRVRQRPTAAGAWDAGGSDAGFAGGVRFSKSWNFFYEKGDGFH